jgi:outer membrane murein-binding lipoprotein Lpp
MKSIIMLSGLSAGVFLLTGCASNAAIKAYATTAEEHASVMELTFDRCMNERDAKAREAACKAVKSSIKAYKQSAAELSQSLETKLPGKGLP